MLTFTDAVGLTDPWVLSAGGALGLIGNVQVTDTFSLNLILGLTGQPKVWGGATWAHKPAMVRSGSTWTEKPLKVWDGSTWKRAR